MKKNSKYPPPPPAHAAKYRVLQAKHKLSGGEFLVYLCLNLTEMLIFVKCDQIFRRFIKMLFDQASIR